MAMHEHTVQDHLDQARVDASVELAFLRQLRGERASSQDLETQGWRVSQALGRVEALTALAQEID